MNRTKKIMRGGSWISDRGNARAAYRYYGHPDVRYSYIGFRVKKQIKADTTQLRGGSWNGDQFDVRVNCRYFLQLHLRINNVGFRVTRRRRNE